MNASFILYTQGSSTTSANRGLGFDVSLWEAPATSVPAVAAGKSVFDDLNVAVDADDDGGLFGKPTASKSASFGSNGSKDGGRLLVGGDVDDSDLGGLKVANLLGTFADVVASFQSHVVVISLSTGCVYFFICAL
jgi:hypothetical protein